MSLEQQAPSNNTQTSNEETAYQTLSVMKGLKEYLKNSNCDKCRTQLREIFFTENKIVAGSPGAQPSEPGEMADLTGDGQNIYQRNKG